MKLFKRLFCKHTLITNSWYSKAKYIHTANYPKGKCKMVYDIYKEATCNNCGKVLYYRKQYKNKPLSFLRNFK